MKITDIKIRLVTKENDRLKAVASVVFDECFVLHDIKIIDGKLGLFIAMPSRKTPSEYGNARYDKPRSARRLRKNGS